MTDRSNGLKRLGREAAIIDQNVYGLVISNFDRKSESLCSINKDWSKPEENPYTGLAAEWIRELHAGSKAVPHLIEYDGEEMVVKAMEIGTSRFSKFHKEDIFNLRDLRRSIRENKRLAETCMGVTKLDYHYLGLDTFANELLNNYNAEDALGGTGLINTIHTYAICNRYSLIMSRYAKLGDLISFAVNSDASEKQIYNLKDKKGKSFTEMGIRKDVVRSIIGEVCIALSILQDKIQMVHADLKAQNILIDKHASKKRFSYDGLTVESEYEIRIADYGNASSTLPDSKVRIFNENRITRVLPSALGLSDFKLEGVDKSNTFVIKLGELNPEARLNTWWRLGVRFNSTVSLITAHSGMPYYKSYDFYIFMVSLMCIPHFYYAVMGSELYGLWASMWLDSEREKVTKDCLDSHDKPSSLDHIISIVKGYYMSCQAIPVVMDLLKTKI